MKIRMPFFNTLMVLVLLVMAVVQLTLVWEFWASFADDVSLMAMSIQIIGVCLAVLELVALIVASHAADRGQPISAHLYRFVFAGVFALNLAGDIGAVATYTERDAEQRRTAVATFDAASLQAESADARIKDLRAALASEDLDLPTAALAIQRDQIQGSIDQPGISRENRAWRQRQLARLESAVATSDEIDRLEIARTGAQQAAQDIGARPSAVHPQFESLSRLLGWIDINIAPDDLRTGLATLLAAVLRLSLAFGFWVAIPRQEVQIVSEPAVARVTSEPSSGGGGHEDPAAGWPWPQPQTEDEPAPVSASSQRGLQAAPAVRSFPIWNEDTDELLWMSTEPLPDHLPVKPKRAPQSMAKAPTTAGVSSELLDLFDELDAIDKRRLH